MLPDRGHGGREGWRTPERKSYVIGKTVQGYKVTEKIRDGSVGTVWKAFNPEGQTVALKQISIRRASDAHKLKEFEHEADLTRSLEHPQIIKVYDYVKAKPQPFFVMEYFESESLKHTIVQLPERVYRKEFQILWKLADALAYLHGREILHKDVKPENVLVSKKGDIRLIDFRSPRPSGIEGFSSEKRSKGLPSTWPPSKFEERSATIAPTFTPLDCSCMSSSAEQRPLWHPLRI
jgi:serine/threonine-protein kinase